MVDRRSNLIECSNPKCGKLYDSSWHKAGKAVMRGKWHYCKKECADEHKEDMKLPYREQL